MQSDPASDELVERMARAVCDASHWQGCFDGITIEAERDKFRVYARAALAVARPAIREECARVAEGVTSYDDAVQKSAGCYTTGQRIAAAIRAME
jgi:hypothetical protein